MKKSYELIEKAILESIIIDSDLMKELKLDDKHFKSQKRLWLFIKECYKRNGFIDIPSMARICPNASDMIDYVADIISTGTKTVRFNEYQDYLLELYDDFEKIEEIYKLAKKLYIRDIGLDEFKKEIKEFISDEEQDK